MVYYYKIRIGLAQINPTLGDFVYNKNKIIEFIKLAENSNCDFILFPEMAITGYPVRDLIFIHDFVDNNIKILNQIKESVTKTIAVVGCITKVHNLVTPLTPFFNSAAVIYPNKEIEFVHKHLLPNYDVFDEKRYFLPSDEFRIFDFKGLKIGIEICEDLWDEQYTTKVTKNLRDLGANCILNINASPYYIEKPQIREQLIQNHVKREKIPLVYLNMVGGQDEITFDGRSLVYDDQGHAILRMSAFQEEFSIVDLPVPCSEEISDLNDRLVEPSKLSQKSISLILNEPEEMFNALVLNLRDYFRKVGVFKKIVLGLSGGIDSSFTAVVACTAVGPENVIGLLMPSRYSSDHSITDAEQLCRNLGMKYIIVPIKPMHEIFEKQLWDAFSVKKFDLADENLQSRLRGVILMYYSNKFDALLLSTGNKSEIATGYCTLYGDTNGGKNVPGDLYKEDIYRISNWINEKSQKEGKGKIIPQNCIDKVPSAELKENQKDQDTLPPYELLDKILIEFIENERSVPEIISMGFDKAVVERVEKMYYNAEFKRAQLSQTIKIRKKGFGIGRRIPVMNKYHLKKEFI